MRGGARFSQRTSNRMLQGQHAVTLFTETTVRKLRRKAMDRGYDPEVSVICEPWMVEDAPRSGRPRTSQVVVQHIIDTVTKNSTHRGWSCQKIASTVSEIPGIAPISAFTIGMKEGIVVYLTRLRMNGEVVVYYRQIRSVASEDAPNGAYVSARCSHLGLLWLQYR